MKKRVTLSTEETTVNGQVIPADSQVIDEPGGLIDRCKLKLERHEEFHSIIESFEGDLIFYGSNGEIDGGADFIREKEQLLGPDGKIKILIEIAPDDVNYETLFKGVLGLDGKTENPDHTINCPIIREDLWSKFIARMEVPVDLQSPVDLDGNSVDVVDAINCNLKPQKLKQQSSHEGKSCWKIPDSDISEDDFIQIDFDTVILDEIQEKFTLLIASNPEKPGEILRVEYAGEYTFDIRVVFAAKADYLGLGLNWAAVLDGSGIEQNPIIKVYFQVNDETPVEFDTIQGPADKQAYTFGDTIELEARDLIRVYAVLERKNSPATGQYWLIGANLDNGINDDLIEARKMEEGDETYFRVTGQTVFPATNSEGFLVHDAAAAIIERITGQESKFYSEFLGSPFTKYQP